MEVNLIGTLSFRALGNPKEELFVPDADADRFLREVRCVWYGNRWPGSVPL